MQPHLNGFVDETERTTYLEQLVSGRLPQVRADQRVLTRLLNPAVRGPFLEALLLQPLPAIQEFAAILAAGGDERAVVVVAPLLHSLEEPVVLTAIDALLRLGSPAARPALAERAEFDQRISVRRAAKGALEQIPAEVAPSIKEIQLPLHAAYLTVVDGAGGQMAVVARRWEEDDLALFHVIFDDTAGILESFGFPSQPTMELVDTLDDLEDDGLTPVAVPLSEVRAAVDDAYRVTLEQQGRVSVGFAAWQSFLAGDDPRDIRPVELPEVNMEDDFETFTECHQLLGLDEFGTWYFEAGEISSTIDRLNRLQRKRGARDYEGRVVGLIRQTLSSHVTPERRQLFKERLERQASLLMRIYDEEPIHARRALAGAAALAEEARVPVSEHPLLQEMLVRSLEDAINRPLIDREEESE